MAFNELPRTITGDKSPAYKRQEDEWLMINTLLGGTGEMRKANTRYLPMLKNETKLQYETRLYKSVLAPFFKRAVNFSAGKAFFKPLRIESAVEKGEISDNMQLVIEDANRKNDSLAKFAHTAFKSAWAKGLGYIYVEAPAFDSNEIKTEAQMKAGKYRPYMLYLPAEDVLDIEIDEQGNIIYVKMIERYTDFNKATNVTEERIRLRVVTPEWIGVYEQPKPVTGATQSITAVYSLVGESMPNKIGKVPLVPIYTGEKQAEFECASAFIDLAYTNVQYYQDESTHESAISAAEFPILCLTGGDASEITIGPFKLVGVKDPAAKLVYVEHSGAALEAGRKNLEELRTKAAYCGMKVLSGDTANGADTQTATEAEIESIDTNSDLKVAADNFIDSLNMALWYVQLYLGEVKSDTDKSKYKAMLEGVYTLTSKDVRELAALMELERDGKMQLETLYGEMKRRGTISDDVNIEMEIASAELKQESVII
jgi:hypothetical protein